MITAVLASVFACWLGLVYDPTIYLSGSYTQALEAARNDPDVTEVFGGPIERSFLPFMSGIKCNGSTYSAD